MAAETPTTPETPPSAPTPADAPKGVPGKEKALGKWFQKIPKEILFSPGGAVLIFFALIIEIIDLIPIPLIDNIWELPLELIFLVLLSMVTKLSIWAMIIPFIIERIPGISDVVPTWLIRLFI